MRPKHRTTRFPDLLCSLQQACRWLAFTPAVCASITLGSEPGEPKVDAAVQERVARLIQAALGAYSNGGDPTNRATSGSSGTFTNAEENLREASRLMPARLDLRFALASSLVSQAIQTNADQLELKMRNALSTYQEIRALDTNGFEASLLYAAYTRAFGETNDSDAAITDLMAVDPERTLSYMEKFRRVDAILQMVPNDTPQRTMPRSRQHAIVILGAALETNGTVKAKLAARLQQGLKLARIYPKAPIVLTGGNPKCGMTESYAMSLWLLSKGIPRKRLYLEDQAKDTVGNALFSAAILENLRVTHVTLVTSSNHIRRGLADLEEACLQRGLYLQFGNLAAKGELDFDKTAERIGVYKDVLRTSGLWAFPGVHR